MGSDSATNMYGKKGQQKKKDLEHGTKKE